ncbi:sensor histidine kinase [Clostridium sp. PL3]|uniref:Sensor histidine kinase n=1 Tax=Clostridium thailandense TaxID=2794346 RepID=A0A949WWQ5_9CLOT|nr:ATP-binding protein [Clostridium thailandense]MBV7275092.1 sensor histidine kinase [Clostridium thailandense]
MNYILSTSLITLINTVDFHLLLTRKRSIKYCTIIFVINYFIVLFGTYLCDIFLKGTIFYKYIVFILVCTTFIIYVLLIFEESISKKIFTMFTVWLFSIIILLISSYIIGLFSIKDLSMYKYLATLLRTFIEFLVIPIVYLQIRSNYKKLLKLVTNKVINIISFYSIMIFLFLVNYYDFNANKPINAYGLFNSLMFIIIITLSYIIIFTAIWSVNRNVELEYKLKIIDTQIELQKQNYKTLNKSIENYYAFKHDIRHHLLAIKSMMDAKNYMAASEYFEKFSEREICENTDMLCRNFTVDSILKYYMSIAKNSNIEFKVNLNIPENINIDILDLSIVIGNCIENAIEACNKDINKSEKYINIKAGIKGFNLLLKIDNSFNGQVVEEDKMIKTSKKSQEHGIGLCNVRKIAEKYNGFFDVKYTSSEFQVSIIMNFS